MGGEGMTKQERDEKVQLELIKDIKKIKTFIEYARYELKDGKATIGCQFPHQEDADVELKRIDTILSQINQLFGEDKYKDLVIKIAGNGIISKYSGGQCMQMANDLLKNNHIVNTNKTIGNLDLLLKEFYIHATGSDDYGCKECFKIKEKINQLFSEGKDKEVEDLLTVGFHKGEMDFGIKGSVQNLTIEELKDFRNMIIVAIYVAEDMWRKSHPIEAGSQDAVERKR